MAHVTSEANLSNKISGYYITTVHVTSSNGYFPMLTDIKGAQRY